ncbi:acyl-CoA dehydrogenase [Sphingobium sp. HBC34]|uniref:Acyl-CoA dehydrogenase n=1 Tax=Sphingobium cyanobacteriorum TaxID=3063954 RepID=A0ABT8ZQH4_9SPHN|nr:acyl-CoA dehydrogenase [Sphingobium sp. HBC34]MDO7836436.1 acyl-CoA dehydrogenase [Sphingobium sp. HBC34]
MDFTFTQEQEMLRDAAARLLSQHYDFDQRQRIVGSSNGRSVEMWRQFQDMGLLITAFAEDRGGFGGKASDILVISELLGQHLVVEPYLPSILFAGRALARITDHTGASRWLDRLMEGSALGALAHEEGRGTAHIHAIATTLSLDGDAYVLNGEKRLVLAGGDADLLVVTARTSGGALALLLVDAAQVGVTRDAYVTIDGRRAANIRFDNVRLDADAVALNDAAGVIQDIVNDAIFALSAEAVGSMGALLAASVEYAATRKQFGVAIGSFQALAHRLADMKLAFAKARSTLFYTAAIIESEQADTRTYSLLKAQVGRLGRAIAESAVQIHGGVGTTDEVAVGHHLKRIMTVDAMFGSVDYHLRLVGAPG